MEKLKEGTKEYTAFKTITLLMLKLRMPSNIIGNLQLKCAILMCVEDVTRLNNLNKLYSIIGEQFGSCMSTVKSNIARAIKIAAKRGNRSLLEEIFTSSPELITNREFIETATIKILGNDLPPLM